MRVSERTERTSSERLRNSAPLQLRRAIAAAQWYSDSRAVPTFACNRRFSRDPFDFRFHFLVVENSIRHALAITSTALSAARRLRVVSLPPAADFERKINKYNFSFLTLLLTACAFFEPFFFPPFF